MFKDLAFLFILCLTCLASGQETKVYTTRDVSSLPYFNEIPCTDRGSEECFKNQMKAHTIANFDYPRSALEKRQTGKVYVQFVIDTTGNVRNIKSRSLEKIFKEEGIRIVKQIPKLQPALVDGKAVAMIYAYPIEFNLIVNNNLVQKQASLTINADNAIGSTEIVAYNAAPESPLLQGCEKEKDWSACFKAKMEDNFTKRVTSAIRPSGNIKINAKVYFEINKAGAIVNPIVVSGNKKVIEVLTKYLNDSSILITPAKNDRGEAIQSFFNYELNLVGIRREVKFRN